MKRIVQVLLMAVLGISSLLLIGEIDERVSGPVSTHAGVQAVAPASGTGSLVKAR